MRLLLAEDSVLLREALVALLERLGHTVVAAVPTATELTVAHRRLSEAREPPDLVVTDVRMPPSHGDDGLAAALAIRAAHPEQPVMALSQYLADTYARQLLALPGGGIGYLLKDRVNRIRDFHAALVTVADGGTVIDPDVVRHVVRTARPGPVDALTPREREVLALMADGRSNTEIAARLVLSAAAVGKHVGNIFRGLGLTPVDENRRVKAVLAYLQRGR